MSERCPCVILGCRRTFKRAPQDPAGIEYMCGNHYRLADKTYRQMRTTLKRRANRHGWTPRMGRIDDWLWSRIKRQAQERSMGL